ncbi:MAG: N-succinylarginine dihydrolase [Oceanospirillaceae bacterium]|nr:N-succinylarginine dihydrolase [Oceanospirillaceae bacterium]
MGAREVNFDGLVGPTHNYAGLSYGNRASSQHRHQASNPKEAALQGLLKMSRLMELSLIQGILPPHPRPDLKALRQLGFCGSDQRVLQEAASDAPELLAGCYSASAMWAANAATVSPSADSADGRVHFSPANLISNFHRSLEAAFTGELLKATFPDPDYFAHHPPLPACARFADEGAANHTRLGTSLESPGVQLFVHGAQPGTMRKPQHYPARQTLEANLALARRHRLKKDCAFFVQQNPQAIDQGVFHNDVIAVGNGMSLFYHEQAFAEPEAMKSSLEDALGTGLRMIEVPQSRVSVEDAVRSYLFNSQLLTLPSGECRLLAPTECLDVEPVRRYLDTLTATGTGIDRVETINLRQSMANGGGPACLRLRVILNDRELAAVKPESLLTKTRLATLVDWVERHYRDRLTLSDLADPQLAQESKTALEELARILKLEPLYAPFL